MRCQGTGMLWNGGRIFYLIPGPGYRDVSQRTFSETYALIDLDGDAAARADRTTDRRLEGCGR